LTPVFVCSVARPQIALEHFSPAGAVVESVVGFKTELPGDLEMGAAVKANSRVA
jgi:hypothetical protein